jgi:hypothetical protein
VSDQGSYSLLLLDTRPRSDGHSLPIVDLSDPPAADSVCVPVKRAILTEHQGGTRDGDTIAPWRGARWPWR